MRLSRKFHENISKTTFRIFIMSFKVILTSSVREIGGFNTKDSVFWKTKQTQLSLDIPYLLLHKNKRSEALFCDEI